MALSISRSYQVVDVFTENPLEGNPLAVFPDGAGIDDRTMQRIAQELNLSETVFVLPPTKPEYAAKLRIFTPGREIPFAGHPTVGTSFVLLARRMACPVDGRFVLEENIGPVPIRVEPGDHPLIWLTTPPISFEQTFDAASMPSLFSLDAGDFLPIPPQLVSAGNPTILIAVKDKAAVDRVRFSAVEATKFPGRPNAPACFFVFAPVPDGAYSRMFAPEYGVTEDPATGSSTGPLAAYMLKHKLISDAPGTRFFSEQGTKMGRRSILHVELRGQAGQDGIDIGGHVVPFAEATMKL